MPFNNAEIQVRGVTELQREMRDVDRAMPRVLRTASQEAAEFVVSRAGDRARQIGGVARRAAEDIRAAPEQRGASVILGRRYAFTLGAEFGSTQYRQFGPWRGSGGDSGYFLYPTIREERDAIIDVYLNALERVTKFD